MKYRRHALDVVALLLLTVIAVEVGLRTLDAWQGPAYTLTNELYVPAAMFASGAGFINPPLDEAPGLREFLYLQPGHETFTLEQGAPAYSRTQLDPYQQYHRYLIYAMGIVWRVFGITWGAAKLLAVGSHVALVLVAYGILRFAFGAPLAFAGAVTIACASVTTFWIFNIRDYGKAPFLLACIGIALYLLRRARVPRHYLMAAAAMGVVAGLGLGFRRDLMAALPALLAVLALAPIPASAGAWRVRAGAAALFALLAMLFAAPVLLAFSSKGSLAWHDMLMGMTPPLEQELGLRPASYARVPVKHDSYVSGLAAGYARRELIGDDPAREQAYKLDLDTEERMLLRRMVTLFPADMWMRGCAAVVRVLQGVGYMAPGGPGWWSLHLERFGVVYAVGGLAGIAAWNLRLAVGLGLLLLYFGGITSLQYETRHAFHLYIAPVFFFLLPIHMIIQLALRRVAWPERRTALRNVGLFVAGMVLLLGGPWVLALGAQQWQLRAVERELLAEPLETVAVQPVEFEGWTYFKATSPPRQVVLPPRLEQPYVAPLYLMVELECFAGVSPIHVTVESRAGWLDFSQHIEAVPVAQPDGTRVRYYFNVPEHYGERDWVRFESVGLPSEYAAHFKGLYLVTTPGPIGVNCNYAVVGEGDAQRRFQWMRSPFDTSPRFREPGQNDPTLRVKLQEIHRMVREGQAEEALPRIGAALAWGLGTREMLLARAEALQALGRDEEQRAALLEALKQWPGDTAMAYAYEKWVLRHVAPEQAAAFWEAALEMAPGNPVVTERAARARQVSQANSP